MAEDHLLNGVIAINKPFGMSSAQVIRNCLKHFHASDYFQPTVQEARRKLDVMSNRKRKRSRVNMDDRLIKVGHGGTLDPLATGVLVLGIGSGTRTLSSFLECTKTYETTIVFGVSTDSYDRCGRILSRKPYEHVTRSMVEEAIHGFKGTVKQVPPIYSALKMNGKPLYEYAREGLPIPRDIPSRTVHIHEIEMLEWLEPGTHHCYWPTEEANEAEFQLAERLWRNVKENEERSNEEDTPSSSTEEKPEVVDDTTDVLSTTISPPHKRKAEDGTAEVGTEVTPEETPSSPPNVKRAKVDESIIEATETPAIDSAPESTVNSQPETTQSPAATAPKAKDAKKPARKPFGHGEDLAQPIDTSQPPPWRDPEDPTKLGPPAVRVRFTVSTGFYVRSFAHDLGQKLGSAAIMTDLCRTRQSRFRIGTDRCLEYTDLDKGESVWSPQIRFMMEQWAKDGREITRNAEGVDSSQS